MVGPTWQRLVASMSFNQEIPRNNTEIKKIVSCGTIHLFEIFNQVYIMVNTHSTITCGLKHKKDGVTFIRTRITVIRTIIPGQQD